MKFLTICSLLNLFYLKSAYSSLCIAHRGDNKYHLENSEKSIQSAIDKKSDGIEIDIRHTKDGFPILYHDKKLKRLIKSKPQKNCPVGKKIKSVKKDVILNNCQYQDGQRILELNDYFKLNKNNTLTFLEYKDIPSSKSLSILLGYIEKNSSIKIISFKSKILKIIYKYLKTKQPMQSDLKDQFLKLYYFRIPFHPKWIPNIPVKGPGSFEKRLRRMKKLDTFGIWVLDVDTWIKEAFLADVKFITTNDPHLCLSIKDKQESAKLSI